MRSQATHWVLGLSAGIFLFSSPARASHFTARRRELGGREQGIVASHGMDLFEIDSVAGGYSPARRAEIIAARLEDLAASHQMTPEVFGVGFRNGEVIIQQQEHSLHLPHIVATVDRHMAHRYPGAHGSVERLARWWLALLRDNLCLAIGRMPVYTTGTPVGEVFQKVYAQLGNPSQPVSSEAIDRALSELPAVQRQAFRNAAGSVPESYSPDRVIVIVTPPSSSREQGRGSETSPPSSAEPTSGAPTPGARPSVEASAQPAGPAPNVRQTGKYRLTLSLDPDPPAAGGATDIELKVVDTSPSGSTTGGEVPVAGAAVEGWFLTEGQAPSAVLPRRADAEDEAGLYGWYVKWQTPGRYRLAVEVKTTGGETIRAEFPVAVVPAAKPAAQGGK